MNTSLLSIILPTLNEAENIGNLISILERMYHPKEIIVVDDNSTDDTRTIVNSYKQKHKNLILIHNTPPLGLTLSLRKGIDYAKSKYVVWMDSDFSHPPQAIKKMLEHIKNADIVVGSWLVKGGRDLRNEHIPKLFSFLVNTLCQLCFGTFVHAYTSGFILAKRSIFTTYLLSGYYGEYCIKMLVDQHRMGRIIKEVPLFCVSRKNGITKTAPNISTLFQNGLRYLKVIISLLSGTVL